ncbi:MAG: serine hydrolase domain-containing protein [Bacteroidota bacterium]
MKKFLAILLICQQSFGQHLVAQLDSMMGKNFPQNQPGAALLIVENGKTIYAKSFGLADIDTKEKITAATNFRMASVSKQFTAMCVMLLVKQQKISYDDNLLKFFPDWSQSVASKITIKQLLTHSSGIWDYEELIPQNQQTQISDADVVSYLIKKDKTYFEPDSTFQYSNSGFCVLEQIIEIASGQSFSKFMEQNIFKPLGMNSTIIYQEGKAIPNRAMGFTRDQMGEIVASDQSITSATKGDGCVYTSLNDYQKWANAVINNKLVNIGSQLGRINKPIEKTDYAYYGLGWFNALGAKNNLVLYHTGSTCGFSNVVKIFPKGNLIITYFSNIADNHAPFYEVEKILKKNNIDESEIDFKKMLDLTR